MAALVVDHDWSEEAKRLLKAEMARHGASYGQLVAALSDIGVQETEANLRNKVSRGGFSAAFLLQCLYALGTTMLHLQIGPVSAEQLILLRAMTRSDRGGSGID